MEKAAIAMYCNLRPPDVAPILFWAFIANPVCTSPQMQQFRKGYCGPSRHCRIIAVRGIHGPHYLTEPDASLLLANLTCSKLQSSISSFARTKLTLLLPPPSVWHWYPDSWNDILWRTFISTVRRIPFPFSTADRFDRRPQVAMHR